MTGSFADATQKDLDAMVQLIAGFSQVIISNDPVGVGDLQANGAPSLTGAGWIFKFAVEHGRVFERNGDTTSVLKELFENVTIDGVTLAEGSNIEYVMSDIL